jgi:hypothetical protein
MRLAPQAGERNDHSFINTWLQPGVFGVQAVIKTALGLGTPLKQGVNDSGSEATLKVLGRCGRRTC